MTELFFILVVGGLMLIGAEIFIPGGILGVIGGLALFASSIVAFKIFSEAVAIYISIGIIIMIGVVIALWIKFFPKTWVGKQMMIASDLHRAKGTEDGLQALLGTEGITTSSLHPGGFAEISGHRYDVITQGEMIDVRSPIRVIEIEGNRIVVEQSNEQSNIEQQ